VVRIGPNALSYTNSEAWKDIYGHRSGKPEMPKEKIFYSQMNAGLQSIAGAERERHAHLRRLLAHGFSDKALREQEREIQRYADQLMMRLRERGKLGQEPLDLVAWYNVSG